MTVAFAGRHLTVTIAFHRALGNLFPNMDLMAEYRQADQWLDKRQPSRRWRNPEVGLAKRLRAIESSRNGTNHRYFVKQAVLDRWKRNQEAAR